MIVTQVLIISALALAGNAQDVVSLGCWNDKSDRALSGGYVNIKNLAQAKEECAARAKSLGSTVFALQYNSECFAADPNAGCTYQQYGESSSCSSTGRGGTWSMNVYKIGKDTPTCASATTSSPAGGCFEFDIAYPHNDIGSYTRAASPEACQVDCQNRAGCIIWTFNPAAVSRSGGNECYMKNKMGTRTDKPGKVSGPANCPPSPPPQSTSLSPVTEILPPQTTTMEPPKPPGLALGVRCNSKSPPCAEPNSDCITYRCKCMKTFVRYPRNGDNCIEQTRLELGTPCTNPGLACSAANSECRAYRCFCKAGYKMSADGQECE